VNGFIGLWVNESMGLWGMLANRPGICRSYGACGCLVLLSINMTLLTELGISYEDIIHVEILRFAQNDMYWDIFQRKFVLPDYFMNLHCREYSPTNEH